MERLFVPSRELLGARACPEWEATGANTSLHRLSCKQAAARQDSQQVNHGGLPTVNQDRGEPLPPGPHRALVQVSVGNLLEKGSPSRPSQQHGGNATWSLVDPQGQSFLCPPGLSPACFGQTAPWPVRFSSGDGAGVYVVCSPDLSPVRPEPSFLSTDLLHRWTKNSVSKSAKMLAMLWSSWRMWGTASRHPDIPISHF